MICDQRVLPLGVAATADRISMYVSAGPSFGARTVPAAVAGVESRGPAASAVTPAKYVDRSDKRTVYGKPCTRSDRPFSRGFARASPYRFALHLPTRGHTCSAPVRSELPSAIDAIA